MIVLMLILLNVIIITNNVKAQLPTVVKGYVYIDENIKKPEEIHLKFTDQSRKATIYDDGRYIIIFENETLGTIGTFYIIYSGNSYKPPETLTLIENQFLYDIDLHIKTSNESHTPEEPANIQPTVDAGGPYYEIVNIPVYFNGTGSYDEDGVITKYEWDFGDGTTSSVEIPTHVYLKEGTYNVKLTVTDDDGATNNSNTSAIITKVPNHPPDKPQLAGSTTGSINIDYNFSLQATDLDDDLVQYKINWSDNTEITNTEFVPNGTITTVTHNWTEPGIYTIKAYAVDEKDVVSEKTEQVILIDTIYCQNLGYLIDSQGSGIYDLFYSNITGIKTQVDFDDDLYLLDVDNNGEFDYQFNTTTNELSSYGEAEIKKQETNLLNTIFLFIIIFLMIVAIFLIMLISINTIKQKPKIKKIFYTKKRHEITDIGIIADKEKTVIKDEKVKSIEEQVDELLSKIEKYKKADLSKKQS